jgi:hypothetical protein
MMYAIHVMITTHGSDSAGDYSGSKGCPTFYLDSDVQGILSESHAANVASDVVNPLGLIPADDIHVYAVVVNDFRSH